MCTSSISTARTAEQLTDVKVVSNRTQTASHKTRTTHDFKVGEVQFDTWTHTHTSVAVLLMVANFGEETITLKTGTVLGIAQEISENLSLSDEK
jgi:hypothetical protein